MKILTLIGSLLLVLSTTGLSAQSREDIRARMDSIAHPSLVGEEVFQFDRICFNLGQVKDNGGRISRSFHFRNTGKTAAVIREVTTSCSCLEARYDHQPVEPGATSEIILTFDPQNFSSEVEVKARVYTSFSGRHPSNILTMKAEVEIADEWKHLPYRMGDLRLKRKKVVMAEVDELHHRKERILCANSGRHPMTVTAAMLPSYARLYTDPVIIPAGTEADLWIEIDGKELSGMRDRTQPVRFNLLLKGTGGSAASRMLEVLVPPIEK